MRISVHTMTLLLGTILMYPSSSAFAKEPECLAPSQDPEITAKCVFKALKSGNFDDLAFCRWSIEDIKEREQLIPNNPRPMNEAQMQEEVDRYIWGDKIRLKTAIENSKADIKWETATFAGTIKPLITQLEDNIPGWTIGFIWFKVKSDNKYYNFAFNRSMKLSKGWMCGGLMYMKDQKPPKIQKKK